MKIRIVCVCLWFVLVGLAARQVHASHSIAQYGAVPDDASLYACQANAKALYSAIAAANTTSDRTVFIPNGTYYYFPVTTLGVSGITIQIDGTLRASNNISAWPTDASGKNYLDTISFNHCSDIVITGQGLFDGQGYNWWWASILVKIHAHRPHLMVFNVCKNVLFENFRMQNSPSFHQRLTDIANFTIRNINIYVDTEAQKDMLIKGGRWNFKLSLPTFPLNTDGIDPSGRDVLIQNVTIDNYDDAVAVKPANSLTHILSNCSENIVVENSFVRHGVGMTIGSVPPHPGLNCVRNVTFRNIEFHSPFKAIYVKTNPGTDGYGLISDITYANITIKDAIWWTIYIGPQQQKQPDGDGPGCMLYPLDPNCPTQPRVPMYNIKLSNVTGNGLLTGIIRCNDTKPCTGFEFANVDMSGLVQKDYICENVFGEVVNSNPPPKCFKKQ